MSGRPKDVRRELRRLADVLRDVEACHRRGAFHGGVCPEAVRQGRWRSRLDRPGRGEASVEYRDPERERIRMRDPREADRVAARSDVYAAGALLYEWLEGGPPVCGTTTPFTRPVPPAAAWIASRAMAEGPARYPSAREMRRDVEHLLRLSRRRAITDIEASELPSFSGGPAAAPPRLRTFRVRRRRRRFAHLLAAMALAASIVVLLVPGGAKLPPESPEIAAVEETGLRGLVASWRSRLDSSLKAAGEELDPRRVPLVVVSEVGDPGDLGWPRHDSHALAAALRNTLGDGAEPAEVQRVLGTLVGEGTHPVLLWLAAGDESGTVRARMFYRGVVLTGTSDL